MTFSTYDKVNTDKRGPRFNGQLLPANMIADYFNWQGHIGAWIYFAKLYDRAKDDYAKMSLASKAVQAWHKAKVIADKHYPAIDFKYVVVE